MYVTKRRSLADWIADDLTRYTYQELAARTGVSHGALEHIRKRRNTRKPTLEVLERLAQWWKVPLTEVLEAAGANLDAPHEVGAHQRLNALVARHPRLAPMARGFRRLPLDELEAIVAHLEEQEDQPRRRP